MRSLFIVLGTVGVLATASFCALWSYETSPPREPDRVRLERECYAAGGVEFQYGRAGGDVAYLCVKKRP